MTLGQFLAEGDFSAYFRSHFALPLVAAVWSCPPGTARHYPARYLFEFLRNHGMLSVHGSPTWKTVTGGSQRYVREIAARWRPCNSAPGRRRAPDPRTGPPSATVTAGPAAFDQWSSPLTPTRPCSLLAHPTPVEEKVLGAFPYTANPVLPHTDTPPAAAPFRVRASWNYQLSDCDGPHQRTGSATTCTGCSGWSRRGLHRHPGAARGPWPTSACWTGWTTRTRSTPRNPAAQRRLPELNSASVAFAGAYDGWGFHEDGCRSGVEAARALGVHWVTAPRVYLAHPASSSPISPRNPLTRPRRQAGPFPGRRLGAALRAAYQLPALGAPLPAPASQLEVSGPAVQPSPLRGRDRRSLRPAVRVLPVYPGLRMAEQGRMGVGQILATRPPR